MFLSISGFLSAIISFLASSLEYGMQKKSYRCLVSQNLESPESVFPHPQDAVDRTQSFVLTGETRYLTCFLYSTSQAS